MEFLLEFWSNLSWSKIGIGAIVLIVSVAVSYIAVLVVVVKIPADYFSESHVQSIDPSKPFLIRWGAVIFKNIIGLILLISGIIMLFVPGPGVLAILLGIIMMDIPGKRPFEVKLIKRPAVLAAINNLRAKYKKSPLILD